MKEAKITALRNATLAFNPSRRSLGSHGPYYIATTFHLLPITLANDFIDESPPLIVLIQRSTTHVTPKLPLDMFSPSAMVFQPFFRYVHLFHSLLFHPHEPLK